MSDIMVSFFNVADPDATSGYLGTVSIKVKHFRQYNGNKMSPMGGHTAIFCVNSGMMFSSKCRSNENFCKKTGVKVCIEKMLACKGLPYPEEAKGKKIVRFSTGHNSIIVDLGK
jgi:hypothetical protein